MLGAGFSEFYPYICVGFHPMVLCMRIKCFFRPLVDLSYISAVEDRMICSLPFYFQQSKLLEEYYQKQKKLLNFQVASAPGETWRGLLAALHLQHVNAVNSSQKLTT